MSALCFTSWLRLKRSIRSWSTPLMLLAVLPSAAQAMVSASLSWTASADPSVTGYTIYYGNACHQYTNSFAVGAVTTADVPNLTEDAVYFFAAKAHDAVGNESPFSNEAAFCGFTVVPGFFVTQCVLPTNSTGDQLTYSFSSDVPSGATLDPTNGVLCWAPGVEYASTTNEITVLITDSNNPSFSLSETILIVVADYLQVGFGSSAVQTSQPGSLPITLAASDNITNLQFTATWPGDRLTTPTLTFADPVVDGSVTVQDGNVVVQLQIAPGQAFSGQTVAQLNFQAADGQPSSFINLQATAVAGMKSDGSAYSNVAALPGEVAVVGGSPMLRPQVSSGTARTLALFGNPGANYQIQSTTNLAPPVVWTPVLNHQQGEVSESVNFDDGQPVVYYRLQEL